MTRPLLLITSFVSVVLFPWPLTVLVALGASATEPLVPLAVGLFADALYLPAGFQLPVATALGGAVTLISFFVRSRLLTSII